MVICNKEGWLGAEFVWSLMLVFIIYSSLQIYKILREWCIIIFKKKYDYHERNLIILTREWLTETPLNITFYFTVP